MYNKKPRVIRNSKTGEINIKLSSYVFNHSDFFFLGAVNLVPKQFIHLFIFRKKNI